MEQLTLDQAATEFSLNCFVNNHYISVKEAFIAGAKWQTAQSKESIYFMRQLLAAYDIRYPNAKQLLVGYTNEEALDKINQLLGE